MYRNTITAAALFALVLTGCTADNPCFGKFADPECIAMLISASDAGDAIDGIEAQGIDAERPPLPDFAVDAMRPDMMLECPPGLQRDCVTSCGSIGMQTCELHGWQPCVPPFEKCNGIDDDCDDLVDEDFECAAGQENLCVFQCSTPNAVQTCVAGTCKWSACHDRSVDPGCGICNPVKNTGCAPTMMGSCKDVICNFNETPNAIIAICDSPGIRVAEGGRCGPGDCVAGLGCYQAMGGSGICREVCDLRNPTCQNGRPCVQAKGNPCYGWCL